MPVTDSKRRVEIKNFVNLTNYKTETIVIEKVPEGSGSLSRANIVSAQQDV